MTETANQAVIFNGKEVKLKYPLYALIKMEKETGVKLTEMSEDMSFEDMSIMIWAGMLHENTELTVEEVQLGFDISDMELLGKEMQRAMSASTAVGKQQNFAAPIL